MVGRVLGLDLGEKTLGIAMSDLLGMIASPIEVFRFPSCEFDKPLNRVKYFVEKENIKEIALGLPLHMSGDESDHSKMCREFKSAIEKELKGVKVTLIDERWTSVQSNRTLIEADVSRKKRKMVVDKMAAQIILDTYLMGRK